jgi:hypothetical protein
MKPQHDIAAIEKYISSLAKTTFSAGGLHDIFFAKRREWNLPRDMDHDAFVRMLVQRTKLSELILNSENYPTILRYSWGPVQPLSVALSIKPSGYFSHGTALWIHGVGTIAEEIFVNREQSQKAPGSGTLSQTAIDLAFRNNQRRSKLIYSLQTGITITVLSGKNSKELEVGNAKAPSGEIVRVTSLERTLVDIAVRPTYAGGISKVIEAFRLARGRVSISALLDILQKLKHSYPYHQSIGFYLKRSSYQETDLDLVRKIGIQFYFYAGYGIREPAFDSEFRIYYPKSLDLEIRD